MKNEKQIGIIGASNQPIAHVCYGHNDVLSALAIEHSIATNHHTPIRIILNEKPDDDLFLIKKFNDIISPITVLGFNLGYGDSTKILIKNGFDQWELFKAEHLLIKNKKSKQTRSVRLAIENIYNKITK